MTNAAFDKLFDGAPRQANDPVTSREMDLASSIQDVTEEIIMRLARNLHQETGKTELCLAGGVALNCVANGRLLREGPFKSIWIQPAAGDAGAPPPGLEGIVAAAVATLVAGWPRGPGPASVRGRHLVPDVAADWYDDPGGSGDERWWDGKAWTTHRRPKMASPLQVSPATAGAAAPTPPTANNDVSSTVRPASWYQVPDGSGGQRWWDGHQWTDHRRPAVQPWPMAPTCSSPRNLQAEPCFARRGRDSRGILIVVVAAVTLGNESEEDLATKRCQDEVLHSRHLRPPSSLAMSPSGPRS